MRSSERTRGHATRPIMSMKTTSSSLKRPDSLLYYLSKTGEQQPSPKRKMLQLLRVKSLNLKRRHGLIRAIAVPVQSMQAAAVNSP